MSNDKISETWTMHTPRGDFDFGYEPGQEPAAFEKPPVWMKDFKKSWDNPQDPIKFEFTLADESYAQDAFNFLYNGPANGIKYPTEEDTNV